MAGVGMEPTESWLTFAAFLRFLSCAESLALSVGAGLGWWGPLVHTVLDFNMHVLASAAWFASCVATGCCHAHRASPVSTRNGRPSA